MDSLTNFRTYRDSEGSTYVECSDLITAIKKLRLVFKEPESTDIFNGFEKVLLHLIKGHGKVV